MNDITVILNGQKVAERVEGRRTLADFLREQQGLTGTHLGCEHGVCGACTILMDGVPVRSCIAFAAAADGSEIRTIEGFDDDEVMAIIRQAFSDGHGLQCGFCTPGMLITVRDMILRGVAKNSTEIRTALAGNICRCTGYAGIVRSVLLAAERIAQVENRPEHLSTKQGLRPPV
jgi:carbon-monoxide dehydrogenase small subunit